MALIFPAVGYSPWPTLARTLFLLIHAILFIAPILMRCGGMRLSRISAWSVLFAGNILLILASVINAWVGSNYMFLSYAPEGTPLAFMAANGLFAYFAWLEGIVVVFLRGLSWITGD